MSSTSSATHHHHRCRALFPFRSGDFKPLPTSSYPLRRRRFVHAGDHLFLVTDLMSHGGSVSGENTMLLSDSLEKRCAIKSDGCEVIMQGA
ncbi:hypothetical protein MTR_4g038330 [Medicago truncatula]|uniref:Uncharacterized protein n=1 Tax=Medicago truncatula TaxID=3880 RepID=G7JSJ1_MEDTR|nr:hypothetical protein MTR_4g038330 [Medicago truncatula]